MLKTLRKYWRWMKPKTYLFAGMLNNWRADKPLTPKRVCLAIQTHLFENGTDFRTIHVDGAIGPARYKGSEVC